MGRVVAIITLICLLLAGGRLHAQPTALKAVDQLAIQADFFTVDRLQQLYAVDSTGLLTKYTPAGKPQFNYSNRPLGPLALVDATDPFNVLLYYPEYQTVIILDRTLSPTAELNLLSLGLIDVQVMAMGNDLHLWLYDQAAFKLYKVSPQGDIGLESGDLSLVLARPPRASQLFVRNNLVYLYTPEQGLFQFDIFGQYLRTFEIKQPGAVRLAGQKLFYLIDARTLGVYDLFSFRESSLALPEEVLNFHWEQGLLYGQEKDRIWVWKMEN